jgi:hypothetical protein
MQFEVTDDYLVITALDKYRNKKKAKIPWEWTTL